MRKTSEALSNLDHEIIYVRTSNWSYDHLLLMYNGNMLIKVSNTNL